MSAQWPLIAQGLVTTLPTLPGWDIVTVFDGPQVGDNVPSDFVTVGYVQDEHAGTFTKMQHPNGFEWQESGTIRSRLVSQSGATDLSAVRGRVFSLADAFEAWVRADRTLSGLLSKDSSVETSVDVMSTQNNAGAAQALVLTVLYTTVT